MTAYFLAHWIEWTGWSTTILGIWLTTRRSLWCWPITLAADVLYLVVFYQARLYSDTLLQVFFVAFTIYGWWNWARGVRAEGEVKISPLKTRDAAIAILLGAIGTVILGILAQRLHAALPWLDAALASYSLVGSWWQARRHIANWWLWIVVDILYIGEYIYKQLWPTALLYALLVALAILGLRDWRRTAVSEA
jgi:nicotinamide mononucleotide transporter